MSNSWEKYFSHYSDWDDAHCFNVRLELEFEDEIKRLGYCEYVNSNDMYLIDNNFPSNSKTYTKNKNEIIKVDTRNIAYVGRAKS